MNISRRKILMNAFFRLQFNYCPLIWMCYNRSLNHKINRLDEKSLWIIHSEKESSFAELLDEDESVSIHHQNIQKLFIEMFKVLNGENPQLWMKFFVSGMRPLMNFDKDPVFISLQLILFSAVQKVYDFSVRKSESLYQMILNALKI